MINKICQRSRRRRILRIFWLQKISTQDIINIFNQKDMSVILRMSERERQIRWQWLGHALRKNLNNITKIALFWTPGNNATEEDLKQPEEEQALLSQTSTIRHGIPYRHKRLQIRTPQVFVGYYSHQKYIQLILYDIWIFCTIMPLSYNSSPLAYSPKSRTNVIENELKR